VLRIQLITPLDVLLSINNHATALTRGEGDPAKHVQAIERAVPGLLEPPLQDQKKLDREAQEILVRGRPDEISKRIQKLKKELAKKKKSKQIPAVAGEIIGELNAYVETTLLGWVYAYYFSPHDLAVAEDPFLVRKHKFFGGISKTEVWLPTDFGQYAIVGGGYVGGGLAQIAAVAGKVGLKRRELNESIDVDPTGAKVAAAQLAAVRAVPWGRLGDRSLHLVALKLRLARELVVEAALRPDMQLELAEDTLGLLGPGRRSSLLQTVTSLDVPEALKLLSSSDLYFLADGYWSRHSQDKWLQNPVTQALEMELKQTNLQEAEKLGGVHFVTYGCVHPHLIRLGPYEDYENYKFADNIAERLSHLPLNLAESADRAGIPVDALAILAEWAVREVALKAKMNDKDDWPVAVEAMNAIKVEDLVPLLEKGN